MKKAAQKAPRKAARPASRPETADHAAFGPDADAPDAVDTCMPAAGRIATPAGTPKPEDMALPVVAEQPQIRVRGARTHNLKNISPAGPSVAGE